LIFYHPHTHTASQPALKAAALRSDEQQQQHHHALLEQREEENQKQIEKLKAEIKTLKLELFQLKSKCL